MDCETKRECRYKEVGEILLSSPSLMVRYKDNEKETETANLITMDSDGTKWIHTGDLGYVDEQGFLFLMGRMKRVMFVGPEGMAYKVFPGKIEEVIATVPEVSEVCVISARNGNGFASKAYLVLKKDCWEITEAVRTAVQEVCQKLLPDYLQPFDYEFLEVMPRTVIGKIDYKALEEPCR